MQGFLATSGVTAEELQRMINGNTRQLPGQFETSQRGARRAALERALSPARTIIGRRSPSRYRGDDRADARHDRAPRYINPNNFVWVVVGDAARVRPQLERLGLPIEVMPARALERPTDGDCPAIQRAAA